MTTWCDLVAEVQAWATRGLASYVERLDGNATNPRTFSIINDNLWGSIRLTELERVLVGSPVFQRLRRIRQLGPAYLVYPSATHTRFSHSLGALHRVSTVLDVLTNAAQSARDGVLLTPPAEIEPWCQAVRVGALLHDVGHVFMSHAGERAVTTAGLPGVNGRIDDILDAAAQELDCEDAVRVADLFSYAIVSSDEIAGICERYRLGPNKTAKETLQTIAGALLHSRSLVAEKERWISDVLSGPLDVDKQDYVPRDAMMAGVGVQVEPHRCAEVLRVCDLGKAQIVNKEKEEFDNDERRLVVTFAGITALEDMLLSRMSLFLRVYRHHKLRLAERVVERIYEFAKDNDMLDYILESNDIAGVLGLSDSMIQDGEARRRVDKRLFEIATEVGGLDVNEGGLSPQRARQQESQVAVLTEERNNLEILKRMLELFENRNMPVRAFAYGPNFPSADIPDRVSANKEASEAWNQVFGAMQRPDGRRELESEIVQASIKLATMAGEPVNEDARALLHASVYVDLPPIRSLDLSPVYVYSHLNLNEVVSYDRLFQPSQWLDALRDSKRICYVYAPRRHAHIVHIAAELTFAQRFGAMSQYLRRTYSRCDKSELERFKRILSEKFIDDMRRRANEPVPGLWAVLRPPAFVSDEVTVSFQRFLNESFRQRERLLKKHVDRVAHTYRIHNRSSDIVSVALLFDLVGSSPFCAAVSASNQDVKESDVRLLLLGVLEGFLMERVAGPTHGLLPLKTEGDAVVAIAIAEQPAVRQLCDDLRRCVFEPTLETAIKERLNREGWKSDSTELPGLRVFAARGDVEWREELHDVLGRDVTAMFVLEDELKAKVHGKPMVAWLGEWDGDVEGNPEELTHSKVQGPVQTWVETELQSTADN